MKNYIIPLEKAMTFSNCDIGGKAKSLAQMIQTKLNVPSGIVVTSEFQKSVFERYNILELLQKESKAMLSEDFAEASNASKRIRDAILKIEFVDDELKLLKHAVNDLRDSENKLVFAVRSSGGMEDGVSESWAGQFDSFLDIHAEDVPTYIKHCWASMFNLRAIRYGSKIIKSGNIPPFSVVVQKMITGDFSGIAFSIDPVGDNTSHVRIEAVAGAGDKIVDGKEIPYSVVLGREDGLILKRTFGSQGRVELIPPSILQELMETVLKIEQLFNAPIDVEWTIKGNEIYILQARPITVSQTLRKKSDIDVLPDILDYQLTFKVTGLGFMFADLLCHGFGYLHPLFICNNGEFLQYFTNERMEYAARYGHRWLSTPGGFSEYKQEFISFHKKSFSQLEVISSGDLSGDSLQQFFELIYQYFIRYSKMDFQFTNLTFLYANENPVIAKSLEDIAEFKDIARVWINDVSIDDDCLLNKMLSRLFEQFSVSLEDLRYYKISELADLFAGKTVSVDELENRKKSSIALSDGQKIQYFIGESADIFVDRVRAIEESQVSATIVGQVANRGEERYVTGVVRVINVDYSNFEQMEKEIASMNHGEILVSEFTSPELMIACEKAKAIITDLGGMLSHASIVSRERGIPCVVGTGHVSRSLKNGDNVKIDLDLGIVELI